MCQSYKHIARGHPHCTTVSRHPTLQRMKPGLVVIAVAIPVAVSALLCGTRNARAQTADTPIVRIAELEIDPAQLEAYKAALREEISTSVRVEPGVISLLAVAVKNQPNQVRLFETYASPAAYQSHIHSPHFLKYKTETAQMVRSLRLIETDPILLGTKAK